ncbi:uncharacterized protein LOC110861357 [Folsomia candida]|uniref:Ciliary microtubule inner protein 2A-C-like domain-containing protein n=1 Tax=Folsomia candida TaxID=158441 RepID=A0A226D3C5_FOLCA|nr:uncharacterized protein LOC110861357 [Folsomia candida]OXA39247.1 hypothetical protein Fcan01_26011 [Folsomia candida]
MYCCPCPEPGYIAQPHHIPGYAGHMPTLRQRNGKSFGNASREIIEDPCVSQAPIPILAPPMVKCPPKNDCWRNPVGCEDIGCCDPAFCPQPPPRDRKKACQPDNVPQCLQQCGDPRAHHLNRGPYACPCRPEPDSNIYRCCEPMSATYAGYVPGFTFHSTGRTNEVATFGTKQYMNNCFYMNTFIR